MIFRLITHPLGYHGGMPRKKGTARYTAHVAVAVLPVQKQDLQAEADRQGVDLSTVVRWAFDAWLAKTNKSKTGGRAA